MEWAWFNSVGDFLHKLFDKTGVGWIQSINDSFYRAFFQDNRYIGYFKGILVTLKVSFFAILLGVAIGVIIATIKYSFNKKRNNVIDGDYKDAGYYLLNILDKISGIYITVIRGTPVLLAIIDNI